MAETDEEFLELLKASLPSEADLQSSAAETDEEFLQLLKDSLPSEADLQGATVEGVAGAAGEFATPPSVSQRGRPLPLGAVEDDPRLTDNLFFTQFQRQDEFGGKIKLDTQTGAPLMTRLKLGLTDDPETQQRIIQNTFQGVTVDRVPGNNLIIRGLSDEETGEEYDLLVDEVGASKKDFADLSSVLLEVVGAGLGAAIARNPVGARAGKVLGARAGTAVANIVGGVGGAAAGRSAGEAIVGGDPVPKPGEVATDIALDAFLQIAPFGVGKFIDVAATGARRKIQKDAIEAVSSIKRNTGIDVPLTTGEATGRETVQRLEGIMEKTPGGGFKMRQLTELQTERIRDVQRSLFNGDTPISRKNVNGRVLKRLDDAVQGVDLGSLSQKLVTIQDSSRALKGMLDAVVPRAGGSVTTSKAGQLTREALSGIHDAFKYRANKLYEPVLASNPSFSIDPVLSMVEELRANFPKTEAGETISDLVPSRLSKLLDGLEELPDNVPLNELRAFRTQLNDSLSDTQILGDTASRQIRQLSKAISEAIDEGTSSLPDGTLKAQLERANNFYRSNLPRFQVQGIEELLADPTQRRIGNFKVANQALNDPDQFFRLKEALTTELVDIGEDVSITAGRDAFDALKRSMLSKLTDDALAGPSVLNISDFAKRIKRLEPEVADELIGTKLRQSLSQADSQELLEGDIPVSKVFELFSRPGVKATDVANLVKSAQRDNQLYKNNIIKRLVVDKVDPSGVVRSDDFVDKFLDVGSLDEVKEVLGIIGQDQALLEDVRRLTIQRALHKTAKSTTAEDVREELAGEASRIFKADKMAKLLGDEIEGGKLKAVIGEDAFNVLKDLTLVQAVRDQKETAVQAAGGLIGGSLLSGMILNPLLALPKNAAYYLAASALSNPQLRAAVMRESAQNAVPFGRALVTSEPFLRAMFVDLPSDVAELAIADLQEAFQEPEGGFDEEFEALIEALPE